MMLEDALVQHLTVSMSASYDGRVFMSKCHIIYGSNIYHRR